jgi:hypothetical protein
MPAYKDRRSWLVTFGVLEILLGVLCALLVPLMVLGQAMAARTTGGEVQVRVLLPGFLMYGVLAAVFVVLGIGSIRARRWARALSLIVAWSWLVTGVAGMGIYATFLPKLMATPESQGQSVPESVRFAIMLFVMVILGVIFVVVPGALVLFYQSKHVKATCESRDPVVRWTDRCPLPALALSLWLLFGGVSMLLMPAAYHGVMPLFGILISGVPGLLVCLALAALWFYLAWGIYRLNAASWWITLAAMAFFGASSIITFQRLDWFEMFRAMGYPEAQIEQMQRYPFLQSSGMAWGMGIGLAAVFAYLIYVKRFFGRRPLGPQVIGQP